MKRKPRLLTVLIVGLLGVCLAGMALVGAAVFMPSRTAIKQSAFDRLVAVREVKRKAVQDYFTEVRNYHRLITDQVALQEAFQEFIAGYRALPAPPRGYADSLTAWYAAHYMPLIKGNTELSQKVEDYVPAGAAAQTLQRLYLQQNPYDATQRRRYEGAPNLKGRYHAAHRKYHAGMRRLIEDYGFYDMLLVDSETGDLVYSVVKETDLGANLLNGPYAGTHIARIFQQARGLAVEDSTLIIDFAPYAPSYGAPAAFLASPVEVGNKRIGVAILQISTDEIERIMTGRRQWREEGLGETGETYLIGPDRLLRNNSRFFIQEKPVFLQQLRETGMKAEAVQKIDRLNTTILQVAVATDAARRAAQGETGAGVVTDYRNVPVLSAYCPLNIPGLKWALLAEIDEAEAFAPVNRVRNFALALGVGLALILSLVLVMFSRSVTRAVEQVNEAMQLLAVGAPVDQRLTPGATREFTELAESTNRMIDAHCAVEKFADTLSKGDYSAEFTLRSKDDQLGTALLEIREAQRVAMTELLAALNKASQHEEELRQQSEELLAMVDEMTHVQAELKRKNEQLAESEAELEQKVVLRTAELELKSIELADVNREVHESIEYAQRIQRAILPPPTQAAHPWTELHMIYQPRDVVSGDFFWRYTHRHNSYLCVADCTGHGVPGAMVSIVGMLLMNDIVRVHGVLDPALFLAELNDRVQAVLRQHETLDADQRAHMSNDGMDVSMLHMDTRAGAIHYAGANRPMFRLRKGVLEEIKGAKRPIGGMQFLYAEKEFFTETFTIEAADRYFLFTDGVVDQFGGPRGRKFTLKRLREIILETADFPLGEQVAVIKRLLIDEWMGDHSQTDDITLVAVEAP